MAIVYCEYYLLEIPPCYVLWHPSRESLHKLLHITTMHCFHFQYKIIPVQSDVVQRYNMRVIKFKMIGNLQERKKINKRGVLIALDILIAYIFNKSAKFYFCMN